MAIVRAVTLLVAALVLASCGLKEAYDQSNNAVASFHKAYDAEQYQALYEGSTEAMKKTGSVQDFAKLLASVHKKLGKVKSSKQVGINVNNTNGVTTVQAQMETEFEKGKAQESFIFLQEGEQLQLQAYNINSPTLITS